MSLISIRSLRFKWPENRSLVLGIEELDLSAGEHLFLKGPSGCGKSTLLSILAGVVDVPANSVSILNQDISQLGKAQRDRFRVDHMGLIFQVFNLVPWLNAYENVLLPCRFSKRRKARAGTDPTQTATRLMAEMGLDDPNLLNAPAGELSIGQQQRVAAARAVIGTPEIILADEPTSALDDQTRDLFLTLLQKECRAAGSALVFVSHDQRLEQHFNRSIDLAKINNAKLTPC